MKLTKFKVRGFRCLENIEWVPLKDLSLITGQNDGGKTSLLDAIEIFLNIKGVPEETDYTIINDEKSYELILMEGLFQLSESEKDEIGYEEDNIYIFKACYNSEYEKKVEYFYEAKVYPDVRLQGDFDKTNINILREVLNDYNIPCEDKRTKKLVIEKISEWLSHQTLIEGYLDVPEDIFNMMPIMIIFKSTDALNPEAEVNSTLTNFFRRRIQEQQYQGKLRTIEEEIKKEMVVELDDFKKICRAYCPDITDVIVEPHFDFTRGFKTSDILVKKSDTKPILLEKEGEGRKRRITLAVHEWRGNIFTQISDEDTLKNFILAYDEPDNHLDYSSQRKILDIIRRISDVENNFVVICTHSLNLIDRIPITDIVHMQRINDKTTVEILETDDPDLIDIFLYGISDSMGLKNSIMLNERCFLIVEGLTEFYSLPIIYKKLFGYSPQSGGIRLINGEGSGGVRAIAKFLNDNHRNVAFLLDRDTLHNPNALFTPQNLTNDGFDITRQVYYIGTVEYEDAFSDDVYARAANTYWLKNNGTPWTPHDFHAIRASGDFCEDLRNMLCRETRSPITKPKIGLGVAKAIQNGEVPTDLTSCFTGIHGIIN